MSRSGFSNQVTRISIFLLLILGITGRANILYAQSFDHQTYPKLDFSFNSLALDLGIQPQNLRIDGQAQYNIEANVNGADTLILYASHIDISSVSVDGKDAEFSLSNDSLLIPVVDSSEAGQQFEVGIRYSGRPQFGLLKNSKGTVWTSQLPKAQHHWVPIIDNPHVELKTTINFVVPSGLQVWAIGNKTSEKVASVDAIKYQFKSGEEVPASSLAFAIGKFDSRSTSYGIKKINLALENSLSDTIDGQQLLRQAYDYLGTVEDYLQLEYPYDRLNIILLEDHSWETKSWGASTVFLYQNHGNLEGQLLRGIIGQWFGISQRESQWSQADAITLYQALLCREIDGKCRQLTSDDAPKDSLTTVYDNFGVERWNQWQANISSWQSQPIWSQITGFASDILNKLPAVITWDNYADFWYRKIGQPMFKVPNFSIPVKNENEQSSDSVSYKVEYTLNEIDGELKLHFESIHGAYAELTTLQAQEFYSNKVDTGEVTFTGAQDSIMLQVDPTIQDFRLMAPDHPELVLDEYKPASFLIYEFRNGETVEQRVEAARKLGYHSENADLQLAIKDFMSKELEPEVKAALLGSMADITNGASGTEQVFLDALQDNNPEIRDAGLMALQHYKGNPSILNKVKSVAHNTSDFSVFKKATRVLTVIESPEKFAAFVETVTQQDSVGRQSVFAIQELANLGKVEEAVKRASLFIGDRYRYEIRQRALKILIQHDHVPADWLSRAKELFGDTDPRIRFLAIEGLAHNKNAEIMAFLSEHIQDEYDARVYHRMERVMSNE